MTSRNRIRLAISTALFATGISVCCAWPETLVPAAEPQFDSKDPLRPANEMDSQFAFAACAACHNANEVPGASDGPSTHEFAKMYNSHQFVRLSEGKTWTQRDPHSLAYEALTKSKVADEMAKNLKSRGFADIQSDHRCLTCHAVDLYAGDTLPIDFKPDPTDKKRFAKAEGVACVGCHGVRKDWQSKHYVEPKDSPGKIPWREWDPKPKMEHGMRDLRDPVVKAKLCVSCHVGSAELGRVVTHEMYAAGHPTLPPFELATFLEGEPKHWSHPADLATKPTPKSPTEPPFQKYLPQDGKGDDKAIERWGKFHFHPKEIESAAAREFAVGAIASARAEAELLRDGAVKAIEAKDGLDFARFDCLSCHHDLKVPSDRQKRGYDGAPGRPPLRVSLGLSAGVAAKHAEGLGDDELKKRATGFAELWNALKKAATSQPFGEPEAVKKACSAVIAWCDEFLKHQSECSTPLYTSKNAMALREKIAEAALSDGAKHDPEAAMVLAWAYVTLAREAKALTDDKLSDYVKAKVFPLAVREEPYDIKPCTSLERYRSRQDLLNKFQAKEFEAAFKALNLQPTK